MQRFGLCGSLKRRWLGKTLCDFNWASAIRENAHGAIFFGLVYGYLALAHGALLFASPYLLGVGLLLLGGYVVLA